MKLRQLRCLCAVVDAGLNISRAAAMLHATQPAISKQLMQLEDELGAPLLLRQQGRIVALTEAGERALHWARRTLQDADNVRAAAADQPGEIAGSFTLATSHTHANYLLPPAVAAFFRRYPKVRLNLLQGPLDHLADLVSDGRAVAAITHAPHDVPPEMIVIPFRTSEMVLVTLPGHPLLRQRTLTLEAIAQYPLIINNSAMPAGTHILRAFQRVGLQPHVSVMALDGDIVKTYVSAGAGIGIIPSLAFSAQRDRGLRMRSLGHLFEPTLSGLLLRPQSYLQQYILYFFSQLDPTLTPERIQARLFHDT